MTVQALETDRVLPCALAGAGTALAQSADRVAAHNDWSVFVASEPKECYIVSPPKSSVAKRDGKPTEVQRGDIRLFVAFRPGENVTNEVSFTGGYPVPGRQHRQPRRRRRQLHPRPRGRRRRRVGLDRPGRRQPGGGGAAQARRQRQAHRHLGARHRHRGHLLALGLHRRGRGRRGALPLSAGGLAIAGRNRYLGALRAVRARRVPREPMTAARRSPRP